MYRMVKKVQQLRVHKNRILRKIKRHQLSGHTEVTGTSILVNFLSGILVVNKQFLTLYFQPGELARCTTSAR